MKIAFSSHFLEFQFSFSKINQFFYYSLSARKLSQLTKDQRLFISVEKEMPMIVSVTMIFHSLDQIFLLFPFLPTEKWNEPRMIFQYQLMAMGRQSSRNSRIRKWKWTGYASYGALCIHGCDFFLYGDYMKLEQLLSCKLA